MRKILLCLILANLIACDSQEDPGTVGADELTPPMTLTTVTGDGMIELRWEGVNYEDNLMGYQVFMVQDKSIADLTAEQLPGYPTGVTTSNLGTKSYPRCEDNNAFFKVFGVTAESSDSCKSGFLLQSQDGTKATPATKLVAEDEASILKAIVDCYDPLDNSVATGNTGSVSMAKSAGVGYRDGLGPQRCVVKGLTNGTNYIFMVMAVLNGGEDISWSSNIVEDRPAPAIFSGNISIGQNKYQKLSFDSTTITTAMTAPEGEGSDCPNANTVCGISGTNSNTDLAIYIGRDFGASYKQRLFLSAGTNSGVKLLFRGGLTNDTETEATVDARIPGDNAISDTTDYLGGGVNPVYSNQVYDLYVTNSSGSYYGKVVIGDVTYEGNVSTGKATVPVNVIVQGTAGKINYFHD